MDLAPLTNSYYGQGIGSAARLPEPAVSTGPEGTVAPAADAEVRGVHATEEQASSHNDEQPEERAAGRGEETEGRSGEEALSESEQREVDQLEARDREVRAHEQAHLVAAGAYATGGASFSYKLGPDGKRYATGGEVGISTSKVADDPEATLRKMEQVRRAALAPAEPSPQDLRVAAEASSAASEARREIAEERRAPAEDGGRQRIVAGNYGEVSALEASAPGAIDLMA